MRYINIVLTMALAIGLMNCSGRKTNEKGFEVTEIPESDQDDSQNDIQKDSLKFETKPSNVLLTGIPSIRITTLYKVNKNKNDKSTFIGSNGFHYRYEDTNTNPGNNWNGNLVPGLEAVYGYNMVNVSHYNIESSKRKLLFEKPVLVRTIYYPAFEQDTLNYKPVNRNYFMVSVYDEDTNKDGFINLKDLRRFYLFNQQGEKQRALIPTNYSVFKSEYDPANDYLFVFGQLDKNGDGKQNNGEPIHIFWIDLKDPVKSGQMY